MTKRKRNRIRQTIITNLTYARMQGDLFAIDAAIRDNDTKIMQNSAASESQAEDMGAFKKIWNGIKTEIGNSLKKMNAMELAAKRDRAQTALNSFKSAHTEKELRLGNDPELLRGYMEKTVFKDDRDGRGRLAFALMYVIDDKHEYQRPEESLEFVSEILFGDSKRLGALYSKFTENYVALNKSCYTEFERGLGVGIGLGGLATFSILPAAVSGAVALIRYICGEVNARESCEKLTAGEAYTTLAFGLTLIEASIGKASDDTVRDMIDEQLEHIDSIRADAEYTWTAERSFVDECRERIAACDRAFKRLTEIIG